MILVKARVIFFIVNGMSWILLLIDEDDLLFNFKYLPPPTRKNK